MNRSMTDRIDKYITVGLIGIIIGLTASQIECRNAEQPIRNPPTYSPKPVKKSKQDKKILEETKQAEPVSYKTDDFQTDSDEVILARMIFGEARSCSDLEKTAVAYTALNRANDGKDWNGKTLKEAILKKLQYSCFNSNDVNLEKLKDPVKYDEESWKKCLEISNKVINKTSSDPTNGATHFHTRSVHPYWADDLSVKLDDENLSHIFYRED